MAYPPGQVIVIPDYGRRFEVATRFIPAVRPDTVSRLDERLGELAIDFERLLVALANIYLRLRMNRSFLLQRYGEDRMSSMLYRLLRGRRQKRLGASTSRVSD